MSSPDTTANQPLTLDSRASGLGRATVRTLHEAGGYVSVLDMNEELGGALVEELGSKRLKFFRTDVSRTESVAEAVQGTVEWTKHTGKDLGGVVAAAGVANPSKLRLNFCSRAPVAAPDPDATATRRSSIGTASPSTWTASTSS